MRKTSFFRYSFSLKGYLFYPAILFAAFVTTRVSHGFWGYFFCLLIMIKALFTHHEVLWKYMIAAVCAGILCSQIYLSNQANFAKLPEETGIYQLYLRPDTIRVDGQLLQAQGYHLIGTRKEKVQLYYSFSDEKEKEKWKQQVLPITLQVQAEIRFPESQRNLSGFDYRRFLNRKGIYRLFDVSQYTEQPNKKQPFFSNLAEKIFTMRRRADVYIEQRFPKLTSIYLKSLLLGIKDAEFREQQNLWKQNGILHLFTLSGMHIFFFLFFFRYVLLRIGVLQEFVFILELLFLCFLFFFTGMTTSVGRCALQTGAARSNRFFRQSFSDLDCWSFALVINLLFQPTLLLEAGGQLTYALTFFLLFIRSFVRQIHSTWRQSLCFSFLLTLVTLPFLWYHFHEWYLSSFLFSWFMMPIFSYVILPICCLLFVSSFILPTFEIPIAFFEFFLEKLHHLLALSSRFSFFHFVTGRLPFLLFLLFLVLLGILLLLLEQKKYRYFFSVLLLFLILSGYKYFDPYGMVAYVDVGQGDSIFVQLPFHRGNLLIDTGGRLAIPQEKWKERVYQASNAEKTLLPFLKSQGVKQLDKVLITHADADHMGDLLEVSQEIGIKELIFPEGTTQKQSFSNVAEQISQKGTQLTQVLSGDRILLRDQLFQVLSPFEKGEGENNDSLVIYTVVSGSRFLFTGDLEKEGEAQLLQAFPHLRVDILKAGHHGSKTSSSQAFVAQIDPKIVVFSCGKNNRYGHPHESVVETYQQQGTKIYRTDEQGMIYARWRGKKEQELMIQTIK